MSESRLTFEEYSHTHIYHTKDGRKRPHVYNFYRCLCGTRKAIREDYVKCNHTKSCGCLRRECGNRTWKKNLVYTEGRGGWPRKHRNKPSPNKGKIRIYEPPNQKKNYRYVTPEELTDLYYGPRPTGS